MFNDKSQFPFFVQANFLSSSTALKISVPDNNFNKKLRKNSQDNHNLFEEDIFLELLISCYRLAWEYCKIIASNLQKRWNILLRDESRDGELYFLLTLVCKKANIREWKSASVKLFFIVKRQRKVEVQKTLALLLTVKSCKM